MSYQISYHSLVYFSAWNNHIKIKIQLIWTVFSSECFFSFLLHFVLFFDIRRINFLIELYDFPTVCWRCFAEIISSLVVEPSICFELSDWVDFLILFLNFLLSLNLLSANAVSLNLLTVTTFCLYLNFLPAIHFFICSFFLLDLCLSIPSVWCFGLDYLFFIKNFAETLGNILNDLMISYDLYKFLLVSVYLYKFLLSSKFLGIPITFSENLTFSLTISPFLMMTKLLIDL